ncbi:uncharacterized protein LOC105217929 [Zeugodacus cucurbitae]|uniref:uncharacterized protein LOC105217929 n=1 Tax=Zeugodacus cucurbitae TaxID=28588 RepID=UPI0023D939AA|nr:uncharacterized protein LOC105217929 [Zeugodacus cucurbitae]
MASGVSEKDEENLRQQCENASLEDKPLPARKSVLPPIKLGMSFSDWKQMKDAEEEGKNNKSSRSAKDRKYGGQQRQNPRTQNWTSESHIQNQQSKERMFFRSQQKNLPNFNALTPQRNQSNVRRFQDSIIPPLMPPLSFDEFLNQDVHWSSGPLMQPMFPPMPRMPRFNQYRDCNNQSGRVNYRYFPQKKFSTRTKPKSGDSPINNNIKTPETKSIKKEQQAQQAITNTNVIDDDTNVIDDDTNVTRDSKQQPQIYIQRPRNLTNKCDKSKPTWMVKPQAPPPMAAKTPEEREHKTRLWREYRHAMKPFKNREFKNAKRVVQRLGKKNYEELEEKDRERLDWAVEAVNAHKEMLNARMAQRSARVERAIKNDINDTKRENVFNLPVNMNSNNFSNQKNHNTHDPVWPARQSLSETFLPGGVLLPGGIITQSKT